MSLTKITAYLLAALALAGCGSDKPHKAVDQGQPLSAVEQLREKREAVMKRYLEISDATTRWPSNTDCDGLAWASLARGGGVDVHIHLAEYSAGEIHRRPAPACWNEKEGDVGSKSTVSNDMLVGRMWAAWKDQDLAFLQRLAAFGETNTWVMGKPLSEAPRVVLKPNQIGLLGRMIYALSNGSDDRVYRHVFEAYVSVSEDYERHIQALGIGLQGAVYEALRRSSLGATVATSDESGGTQSFSLLDLTDQMMERLRALQVIEPENFLYASLLGIYSGDFTRATELLLTEPLHHPSYARGETPEAFLLAEWLFASQLVLDRYPEVQ